MTIKTLKHIWDDGNKEDFNFVILVATLIDYVVLNNGFEVEVYLDLQKETGKVLEDLLNDTRNN